jgi:hypothetical protein
MSRRLISVAVGALLFALCLSAEAQQPKKVFRIGFLLAPSLSETAGPVDAFRQGCGSLVTWKVKTS